MKLTVKMLFYAYNLNFKSYLVISKNRFIPKDYTQSHGLPTNRQQILDFPADLKLSEPAKPMSSFRISEYIFIKGSLQKKSVTFFTFGGGSGPVFVTLFFLSKTWSKMA